MNEISLCVIAKPDEGQLLDNLLKNVAKHVDEVIVVTQGNGIVEQVAKAYGAKLYQRKWDFNFANQRNYSFSKATKPFILWLDTDDQVKHPEKLHKLTEMLRPEVMGLMMNYIYQRDADGNILIEHWRERIIRNNAGFKWVGALHETLINESNPPMARTTDVEVIHNHINTDDNSKTLRNLEILEKEVSKQVHNRDENYEEIDPRTLYYLGVTYKELGMIDEAEEILRKFVNMSGWNEHRFGAFLDLVDIAISFNAKKPASDYALMAIGEFPQYPDGYFMAGKVSAHFLDYKKAVEWLKMGFEKPKATGDWINVGRIQQAYLDMAISSMNLGDFKTSKEYFEKLQKMNPRSKQVKNLIKETVKLQGIHDVTDAYIKIFRFLDTKSRRLLLQSIPKEIKDSPVVFEMARECAEPKVWPKKSIVIYCGESWEDWSPKTALKGIGGSEEAVINMGNELTKLGFNVTVYNSCGIDVGVHNKVTYKNFMEFNDKDEFDILIGWRFPGFFNQKFKANKTYLWMHDVSEESAFTPVILENCDKIMVLSKFHRNLWPNIPEDKFLYSANGLLPEQFSGTEDRKLHKIIYSSCPSRGLEVLLDIWPEIKAKYKDAELDVFYGFGNFIKGNANIPSKMQWVEQMQMKLKQPGINFHDRVGHKELAREFMKSDIWAYPCIFPEIYCITAIKAQAAGTVPVVIPYGAVDEVVKFGYKTESSDIMKKSTKEEYKNLLLKAMGEKHERSEMMEYGKSLTWSKVAEGWTQEFLS